MSRQDAGEWADRPTDDGAMIEESRRLQSILWNEILACLDDHGTLMFGLWQMLFLYEKLIGGQLLPGPHMDLLEIRESMKKTLDQAVTECTGGARTHDPPQCRRGIGW